MTKTELALRKQLGDTALALSDETDGQTAARIEALAEELPELREKKNIAEDVKKTPGRSGNGGLNHPQNRDFSLIRREVLTHFQSAFLKIHP